MADINDWDVAAANNNSAPPNGWPENMAYSEVNNAAREGMAVIARFFKDLSGSLAAGGAADAYTLTLNAGYAAYFAGMTFTCSIPVDNTGACTIDVNGIGAQSIVNADGGDLNAGQLQAGGIYRFVYDGTDFVVVGAGAHGSMAQQDASAVAITGGSIAGITDLAVADGGTGASTAAAARTNLGLGALAVLSTINGGLWSGTDLALVDGGTGASTAAGARTNLGLGSLAVLSSINGSLWSGTDLALVDGGTGASTAADARTNLGLAIGSNVQAYSANLAAIAALAVTDSNFIVGNGSAWVAESGATVRTSLGLGTSNSPQFTAVNVGHATDTTLARQAAGQLSVEGDAVFSHQSSTATFPSAKVHVSTSAPSGGSNGDIWLEREA